MLDVGFAASYLDDGFNKNSNTQCLHTIALGNGITMNNRTRHTEIRQRFVTSNAIEGLISIEKIHTDDEVADIFTKPLPRDAFLNTQGPWGWNSINDSVYYAKQNSSPETAYFDIYDQITLRLIPRRELRRRTMNFEDLGQVNGQAGEE